MAEQKSTFVILGQTEEDDQEMHFKTSANQVITEKSDGSKGNVQEVIEALRKCITVEGDVLTINLDLLGGI